jgi:hypothetical protein
MMHSFMAHRRYPTLLVAALFHCLQIEFCKVKHSATFSEGKHYKVALLKFFTIPTRSNYQNVKVQSGENFGGLK